jgi:hypothetical protein
VDEEEHYHFSSMDDEHIHRRKICKGYYNPMEEHDEKTKTPEKRGPLLLSSRRTMRL